MTEADAPTLLGACLIYLFLMAAALVAFIPNPNNPNDPE